MNRKLMFHVALGVALFASTDGLANADDRPKGKPGKKPHSAELQRRELNSLHKGDLTSNRQQAAKQIQQKIVAERLEQMRESRLKQMRDATSKGKGGLNRDLQTTAQLSRWNELRDRQPLVSSESGMGGDHASNSPLPFGKEWGDRKVDRIIQFRPPFDGVVVTKDKNGNVVRVDLADSQIKSSPNGNPWDTSGGPSPDENNNQDSGNTSDGGDNSGGTTNSNGNSGSGGSGSSSSGSGTSSSNSTSSSRMNKPSVKFGNGHNLPVEGTKETMSKDKVGSLARQNDGTMSRGGFRDDGGNPENPSGGGSKFEKPILAGTDSSAIPSGWGVCYAYTNEKGESVEIYCRPGSVLEDVLGPGLEGDTPPTGGTDNSNGGAAGGDVGAGNAGGTAPGTGSEKNKKKNKKK